MVPAFVFHSVIVATLSSTFHLLIELSIAVYHEQSRKVAFSLSVGTFAISSMLLLLPGYFKPFNANRH